ILSSSLACRISRPRSPPRSPPGSQRITRRKHTPSASPPVPLSAAGPCSQMLQPRPLVAESASSTFPSVQTSRQGPRRPPPVNIQGDLQRGRLSAVADGQNLLPLDGPDRPGLVQPDGQRQGLADVLPLLLLRLAVDLEVDQARGHRQGPGRPIRGREAQAGL